MALDVVRRNYRQNGVLSVVTNRCALVTGASRGIGRAIAQRLKQDGYRVIGTSTRDKFLGEWCDEWIMVDFLSPVSVNAVERYIEANQVDILVNNAGINRIRNTGDCLLEDFEDVLKVNLTSSFRLSKVCATKMSKIGWGRVVNIASIWSEISKSGRAPYSASKTGLVGLTRALSAEFAARGVLINAVSPGFIETELTRESLTDAEIEQLCGQVPAGRLGQPVEVAALVSWLVSDENTFMSGQNVIIDGGFTNV